MPEPRVRLVCPLCEVVVSDGAPPASGECPSCRARYVGDGASAPEAVTKGLVELGLGDDAAPEVANALFGVSAGRCQELGIAITSDDRGDFYRWWLFLAADRDPGEPIDDLLTEFRK